MTLEKLPGSDGSTIPNSKPDQISKAPAEQQSISHSTTAPVSEPPNKIPAPSQKERPRFAPYLIAGIIVGILITILALNLLRL